MDLRVGNIVFGRTVNDRYEIVRLIGNGGFGTVYEIKDDSGNAFALKTVLTGLLNDDTLRALQNEAQLATEISHPNVTRIYYFHDGKQYSDMPPYMIMEYADGGTLKDFLKERDAGHYLSSDELRSMFVQLASGMKAINAQLVHRDIKPDNILLLQKRLKISDFGLSKIVNAATRSNTFKGINHVMYCAPEAWQLDKNLPSMDMYSMGITFYEMATLRHPYSVATRGDFVDSWKRAHFSQLPSDPRQFNKELDSQLGQIILKMMSKRPADRYSSWDALIERLNARNPDAKLPDPDVTRLVELAKAKHQRLEKERLRREEFIRKQEEERELLRFSFTDILTSAENTVRSFNAQSEFTQLEIRKEEFGFSIFSNEGGGEIPTVKCAVWTTNDKVISQWEVVRGFGLIKAPSGRGFNLLLTASGSDDLYGRWQVLRVTHNPIARSEDNRREPFGFELNELRDKIEHLNVHGVYQYERIPFNDQMLITLIEELLHK